MNPVRTLTNPMSLNITERKSTLNNLILKEEINIKYFDLIMKYRVELLGEELASEMETKFVNYNKQLKKHRRRYVLSKWDKKLVKYGRVYCDYSVTTFKKIVRNTLCKDIYHDIDIVNCHPVLLSQLCELNGIKCDKLNYYIKNREEILYRTICHYEIDRSMAKDLYLCIINGGSIKNWRKKCNIQKFVRDLDFLVEYKNELTNINNIVLNNNQDLKKHITQQKAMTLKLQFMFRWRLFQFSGYGFRIVRKNLFNSSNDIYYIFFRYFHFL